MNAIFEALRLTVLERGWLSSNNIVFASGPGAPSAVVDTGYSSHAQQTAALVAQALRGRPLQRILNTHLHSDHCGGNAHLQRRWGCEVWVPAPSFEIARCWAPDRLSFDSTGQRCDRFTVHGALHVGQTVRLGTCDWLVVAAPGHDADAVMLFQAETKVLITADALWESKLPILFQELDGGPGFAKARSVFDTIEQLRPAVVIPGHGKPFTDVAGALQNGRQRLAHFEAHPERHRRYAAKALSMFHLLEVGACERDRLIDWLVRTPIFGQLHPRSADDDERDSTWHAQTLLDRLLRDGLLRLENENRIVAA